MGSYSHQLHGDAGGRTAGVQHHNMHSAQYLEHQASNFLAPVAEREPARTPQTGSAGFHEAASSDADNLSLWQQAAGIYSTDGDEGELSWQADALCAQTDPEAFFPEKGGSTRDAKRVCSECPVREACLEYAMENDERFGIWGGLSERERRRLRKQTI